MMQARVQDTQKSCWNALHGESSFALRLTWVCGVQMGFAKMMSCGIRKWPLK